MLPCKRRITSMPGEFVGNISLDSTWHSGQNLSEMSGTSTPRPTPLFFRQAEAFSTKKARGGTPKDSVPPKPPVKSAPPISRIFAHKPHARAKAVTFKGNIENNSIESPHYNEESQDLYFDQCFEIVDKLGVGSFGVVFKVRSKEDGKFYAVKRSRERFRGESDKKRKFEEVAKHEKLPPHPNCVGFIKAWEEGKHLYIQTELCRFSLENFAEKNHNIPEKLIWNYLVDLLMAVKHLHDNDLVHMDIKPENVFISDAGICKLGDFGLVLDLGTKEVGELSEAQEGDPKYLAPELLQGNFNKPADIFSVGLTMLELASDLDLPRNGELWQQLRSGHLPEEFLLGVSENLKTVIRWMTHPTPETRRTVDQILEDPLMKEIWKHRKREQIIRNVNLLSQRLSTPVRENGPTHPLDWDHSFSDDDVFDEGISLHNNSMGIPLDCSSSSDDISLRDSEGFVLPSVPVRRVFTTPGYRHRPPRTYTPQASGSPVLNSSNNSFLSSSPVSSPLVSRGFINNESITPNSSFHERLNFEAEQELIADVPGENKSNIEPKNLMDAFLSASDED